MTTLTSYKLLCFDCYGTLIDCETGVVNALEPLLSKDPSKSSTREEILHIYHEFEASEQRPNPSMQYSEILATIHPKIAARLGLPAPSAEADKSLW
jgi:FMN phosphatase YigB (HAD superfamily)